MTELVWKDVVGARWFLIGGLPVYAIQLVSMSFAAPAVLLTTIVYSAAMAIVPLVIDEIQGTESLWCSLPVSRRDLVLARYASVLGAVVAGLAISRLGVAAAERWIEPASGMDVPHLGLGAYAAMFVLLALCAAAYLPCRFRLGTGRGTLAFTAIAAATLVAATALTAVVAWVVGDPALLTRRPDAETLAAVEAWLAVWRVVLLAAALLVTAGVLAGSAALSVRFYAARDC